MRIAFQPLVLAVALGLGSTAFAAAPPAGRPMPMPGGMMGGGMMDMDAMQCMNLSDQRLAAVAVELNLTRAQQSPWNAFARAAKAHGPMMGQGMMQRSDTDHPGSTGRGMMMGSGTLPDRLRQQETMMSAHLNALRVSSRAASRLYGVLRPDQRAKADRLLCGQMGGRGPASASARP